MDSDGSRLIWLLTALVILGLKFFLGCCEYAAAGANRSKVKSLSEKDSGYARLDKLLERKTALAVSFVTERGLLTALAAVAAALAATGFAPERYKWLAALLGAVVASVVLAAVTNIFARKLVEKNAEQFAADTAAAVKFFMAVISPFSLLVYAIAWIFCFLFKIPFPSKGSEITEEEILMMVDEGNQTGVIEQSQREMINNIFEFGDSVVSEVMTHRTDLCAADVETKIGDIVYLAINEGYSRIPIYEDTVDSIIGILYVKDLLCLVGCEHSEGFTVRQFMRKVKYIPETCKCSDAFEEFTKEKCQAAVVVDEYGGTAGMITLEDLLEEIVGNIQDEYDDEKADISEISEGVYTISGDMNPEDAAEILDIQLPEDHNYDTMSAFIVDLLGRIPDEDETPSVKYNDVEFTVLIAEDNWVSRIKAEKIKNN